MTSSRSDVATGTLRRTVRTAAIAGGLSAAPSTVHALATGRDVLHAVRAAGTLLVDDDAASHRRLVAGAVAHAALSLGWTVVLLPVLRRRRRPVSAGALAGLAIAALDLGVVARGRYPSIAALPAVPQVADHVAFGLLVGWCAGRGAGPGDDPP